MMRCYNHGANVYGLEYEYPREEEFFQTKYFKDYIFYGPYKRAKLFYEILESIHIPFPDQLDYSDPVESYIDDEYTYEIMFTCSEETRLKLEFIFRKGSGFDYLRRDKLLRGLTQDYKIVPQDDYIHMPGYVFTFYDTISQSIFESVASELKYEGGMNDIMWNSDNDGDIFFSCKPSTYAQLSYVMKHMLPSQSYTVEIME